MVHSKYTLIIISLFNLRSPCPLWSPQNFIKVYLFLFMCVSVFCMCIWALHVCLLLMEAWSRNRIILPPLVARLLDLPVVLGPRGGQKQGYRWLWAHRRKEKLASLWPGQLGYWGNRPVYIELEDKDTGEIHLICIMWPFVPMKYIQVFQTKLGISIWPIL